MRRSSWLLLAFAMLLLSGTAFARGGEESADGTTDEVLVDPAGATANAVASDQEATEELSVVSIPATGSAALFINTSPIRAEVVIDGTPVGATPILVRELRAGMHALSIQKPGYVTIDEEKAIDDLPKLVADNIPSD